MEPNYGLTNLLIVAVSFGCYYVGIVVRKVALPLPDSPPWSHQFLLGVPFSLVVVSPLVPVLSRTLNDVSAMLVTLGVIMEHGMLVNETAADFIRKKLRARAESVATAGVAQEDAQHHGV